MENTEDESTVLVVDDEPEIVELYAAYLNENYEVRTARGGSQALDALDEQVDVVLLDRRMPDITGDTVLQEIQSRELSCRVAMVTAVDPDFDIIEMGFDDYLVKPISRAELLGTVDRLVTFAAYDDQVQELFALASKKATLQAEKTSLDLNDSDEYSRLERKFEDVRESVDVTIEELGVNEYQNLFQKI